MAWWKVVSSVPISIDYQNGHAATFGRGMVFEADIGLRDVKRLMRLSPKKIVATSKPKEGGFPAPTEPRSMPPAASPKKKITLPQGVHRIVRLR